jgi:hypothetical protein
MVTDPLSCSNMAILLLSGISGSGNCNNQAKTHIIIKSNRRKFFRNLGAGAAGLTFGPLAMPNAAPQLLDNFYANRYLSGDLQLVKKEVGGLETV